LNYSRLQEAIAMSVDLLNSRLIRYTNMVWLDSDQLSIFLVSLVDAEIPLPLTSL